MADKNFLGSDGSNTRPDTRAPLRFLWMMAFVCVGIVLTVFMVVREDASHCVKANASDLPDAVLAGGALLSMCLMLYLRDFRRHTKDLARMVRALSRSNEALSHKALDCERAATALRASEMKYRAIFENAGVGICQIALNWEWLEANRAMARILGYADTSELLSTQPDLHGKLFVNTGERAELFSRLQKDDSRDYMVALLTKDQQPIWGSLSSHAVRDERGTILYFECTIYDVTERHRNEKALMQAKEQADLANRSKSEFLANMSHELRTPLNAVIGFSEIIKDQLFGPAGQPQYVEYAKDIFDSGHLLLALISDILDMSKIEAGKRVLAETSINVENLVSSVMRLVSARAKEGKLKLSVSVPRDLPPLRGEERAIKQILTNLLTNAIKFTPEGGSVSLTAQMDDFARLVIRVEDSGIGMSTDEIPIALSPFGQIESALSRKNQGTGLGLPLTKALIELHDGVLDLRSRVGKGTVVTVIFPAGRVGGGAG